MTMPSRYGAQPGPLEKERNVLTDEQRCRP